MQEKEQKLRADQHYLPMRVNDPLMVVFWSVDEVRPIILAVGFGVPFDAINITFLLGIIYFVIARKVKAKYAKGIIPHMAWWSGLLPMQSSCSMPDPLIRELFR